MQEHSSKQDFTGRPGPRMKLQNSSPLSTLSWLRQVVSVEVTSSVHAYTSVYRLLVPLCRQVNGEMRKGVNTECRTS